MRARLLVLPVLSALLLGCAHSPLRGNKGDTTPPVPPRPVESPFLSLEKAASTGVEPMPPAAGPLLIRNANVWTATGVNFSPGYVLFKEGRIAAIGAGDLTPPAGTEVLDAGGRYVTPGIIDPHSHMGVYPSPYTRAHDDGNEMTDPVTAGLQVEHSFWPEDPALERAVEGGITTIGVLPGSANLIGGRGVVMHLLPSRGARAMRFPGAPSLLKMACGENPKVVYGEMKRAPSTRMGNLRGLREAYIKAAKYERDWNAWFAKPEATRGAPPDRDLALETLAQVLRGDILVQWHCYQADDMLTALQVAHEFGFEVRSFHHALEAYKIRDVLAREHVAVSTWHDWYGFKMEAYDGIQENLALLQEAGVKAVVHSDSPITTQFLNLDAARAMASGLAAGVKLSEDDVLRWITLNPAWVLGIDKEVGSLETGKRADAVIWSEHPFSSYARAEQVFVDGHRVLDRRPTPQSSPPLPAPPWSDLELGIYRHQATTGTTTGAQGGQP